MELRYKISKLIDEEFKAYEDVSGNWEAYEVKEHIESLKVSLLDKLRNKVFNK